jgi:hypothetical protein
LSDAKVHHDDPASCVDQEYWTGELPSGLREPLMSAVAGLGECAASLPQPSGVRAYLTFDSEGKTEHVSIRRTSTDDCAAIDCVRKHLSEVRVTTMPRNHLIGIEFELNEHPRLNTQQLLEWPPGSERDQCTDREYATESVTDDMKRTAKAALARHDAAFKACSDAARSRNPDVQGLVQIRAVFGSNGRLEALAVVENQVADCKAVACWRAEVERAIIPDLRKPMGVDFVFRFGPKSTHQPTEFFR